MKTIVLVMMILVCFNYILKQTYQKFYSVVFYAAVCALFTSLMWPYAIEQSKSQISVWLSDPALMLDVAVILTLEVCIQMAFCMLSARIQASVKTKPLTIWAYRILRCFPGILILPVLYSALVTVIFAMPGTSFSLVAWTLAAIIFFALPFGTYILKKLLPEKEIRLELLFLSNALIAILGIIATVNGRTAVAGISKINWIAFAGVCVLIAIGLLGGILTYEFKLKKSLKK